MEAGGVLENVVSAGTLITGTDISVTDNSSTWDFTAVDDGEGGIDLEIAEQPPPPPAGNDGGGGGGGSFGLFDLLGLAAFAGLAGSRRKKIAGAIHAIVRWCRYSLHKACTSRTSISDELSNIVMGRMDTRRILRTRTPT